MPNVTLRAMALAEFDEWKPRAVHHYGDRPAFVYYVEVDPAIRGRGLGRAVMAAGEQYATEHGATSIGLHVFDHNLVARRLYDQLGYQVSSTHMIKSLT